MQVKILGSGSSLGVPIMGCGCSVCSSDNPKNKRMRQAIYVRERNTNILIDFGPDIRSQILEFKVPELDAILITHPHSDHIAGLDDIRAFCLYRKKTTNLYMDESTYEDIKRKFNYILEMELEVDGEIVPVVNICIIEPGKKYKVGDIEFEPFEQDHANIKSLGFKFSSFAYSTDFYNIDHKSLEKLHGIDMWIVECLGYERPVKKKAHIRLDRVLEMINDVNPKKAVLIHMSHEIEYDTLSAKLPKNVVLGYDGMEL